MLLFFRPVKIQLRYLTEETKLQQTMKWLPSIRISKKLPEILYNLLNLYLFILKSLKVHLLNPSVRMTISRLKVNRIVQMDFVYTCTVYIYIVRHLYIK